MSDTVSSFRAPTLGYPGDTAPTRPVDPVAELRAGRAVTPGAIHPDVAVLLGSGPVADPAVRVLLAVRGPAPSTPADLVAALGTGGSPAVRAATLSAVHDAFGAAITAHGEPAATAALRDGLTRHHAGHLLDLAERHGLVPVAAADTLAAAGGHQHSAWRYLAGLPDGAAVLADVAEPADAHSALLLAATRRRAGLTAAHPQLPATRLPGATGLTVAQSMLLGDLELPGEGASGGLSVLLASLGDALAALPEVARSVTVVLAPSTRLPRIESLVHSATPTRGTSGHWILHVPVDHHGTLPQTAMAHHRAAITWGTAHLLAEAGLRPDVVHVRYSDDGSLAVADAAAALGSALVFTATADPHRVLAQRYPADREPDAEALHFDLHRVSVTDRLIARAAQVVTIPARPGDDEFARYFPALDPTRSTSVEEGIALHRDRQDDKPAQNQLVAALFEPHPTLPRLTDSARGLPVLLNVGRLHPIKQQDALVEAWLAAGLHRSSVLVVVGGSATEPTPDEQGVLDRITALAATVPAAAGRLAVIPALSNRSVRLLEHALPRLLPSGAPHVYACSSVKEEFGIAVLEAMDAGLLAVGPRRGGLGHYITPGRNGHLVDTTSAATMSTGIAEVLDAATFDPVSARRVAAAGRATVRSRFAIADVAAKFAAVYLRAAGQDAPAS